MPKRSRYTIDDADDAAAAAARGPTVEEEADNTNLNMMKNPDGTAGLTVLQPPYLDETLHNNLVGMLDGIFGDDKAIITRRQLADERSGVVVPMNHKYGREFYVETAAFGRAVKDKAGNHFSREPPDSAKHSIPETTPRLETHPKLDALRALCAQVCQEPLIEGKELYLMQCVHYTANAEGDRGKHIDNRTNGGDIIVGVTLATTSLGFQMEDEYRSITLSLSKMSKTFSLPPASVYVMKGECRYVYLHDAKKPPNTEHYVIMMRFGKADSSTF